MEVIRNETVFETKSIFDKIDTKIMNYEAVINSLVPKMKLRNCNYVGKYIHGHADKNTEYEKYDYIKSFLPESGFDDEGWF